MIRSANAPIWRKVIAHVSLRGDRGAQLAEFAVALPLLVVFVVGIFDFSSAFTLKQKLTNAARDAARAAAADPATDLGSTLPASVADAFTVADSYLLANNLDDCGITAAAGSATGLTWTFSVSASANSTCAITLIINRGYHFPSNSLAQTANVNCSSATATGGQTQVLSTCVSIQYAYPWRFQRAASLLGSNTILPSLVAGEAVAMNEN